MSRYLRDLRSPLRTRVDAEVVRGAAICTIVEAELRFGISKVGTPSKRVETLEIFLDLVTVLPFDRAAARVYGDARADLERAGRPIGVNDPMIDSIPLA